MGIKNIPKGEKERRRVARRIKHGEAERDYSRRRRRKYRANELIRLARARATKKGLAFDLDDHIAEISERVDRNICELSGIALQREIPKAYNTPSLDRIDPAKGYTYENVRVVCYALNCALGTWGLDRLLEIVGAIEQDG